MEHSKGTHLKDDIGETDIAIVGMAAHLPGSRSVEEYWTLLRGGVEAISRLSEEDLLAAGENPALMQKPNYVPAAATLDQFEWFDADFFGLSPKDAAIMDPQHRQFLETSFEAFENAGHMPESFDGRIGVFAGCGMGSYFYFNVCSNPSLVADTGMFLLRHTGNDKDFMSTRVSHIFDLKGPSLSIQTACSTSLVAIHTAAQSLISGECDMALAGGSTIELPHGRGYLFEEGEILSPDGHCHAFDHRAKGTVFGSGTACVLLRRASEAIADGDHIWAIIKGTAVNNDGAAKAGYLAPSVEGQAAAVAEAIALADVPASTIGYVECHGTGTYLGDPIEVAALTQAFRETTDQSAFCSIGSVKTNIGHLDTAAGAASLIKASLSLYHREIPASLNFEAPNPAIDFEGSPFKVNKERSDYPALGAPRRAGVNSLGVGGTNAHAILQEAPERSASDESDWPFQPLVISARSNAALDEACANLVAHLKSSPDQPLADIAYTLKEGRRAFDLRRVIVAESHEEACELLESGDRRRVFSHSRVGEAPQVVFMFPGGGAQYAGMARDLYETEPEFRDWMDRGLAHLSAQLDYDPKELWLAETPDLDRVNDRLKRPSIQLPLIFITEIALAHLWLSWGLKPTALIGHSMGENAAACFAGVMSFEEGIDLVLKRGQLFDTVAPGGMLSVPLAEDQLHRYLGDRLDIASVNGPELCVLSGPDADLAALKDKLMEEGIEAQRVAIDIAAHSKMLEPVLEPFRDHLKGMSLSAPKLDVISNRTGKPLTQEEARDPDYWVAHLRNTVRFADGLDHLKQTNREHIYLEVGPGRTLGSLAQVCAIPPNQVLPTLRHAEQEIADDKHFICVLARLWAVGVEVDWSPIWGDARRNKVPLPTYPFQRSRYFIEPGNAVPGTGLSANDNALGLPAREDELENWGWIPTWRPDAASFEAVDLDRPEAVDPLDWIIFRDETGLSARVIARLRQAGHRVIEVTAGDTFSRLGEELYCLSPELGREGYDLMVKDLAARERLPQRIGHFWNVTDKEKFRPGSSFFHRNLEQGFWSLLFLCQSLADEGMSDPVHLSVLTNGAAKVRNETLSYPERALGLGPVRVIPRELPGFTARLVDVVLPVSDKKGELDQLAGYVLEDLFSAPENGQFALRAERRYKRSWHRAKLDVPGDVPQLFSPRPDGSGPVLLITGGLGGIAQEISATLAQKIKGIRLVLMSRSGLPERADWDRLLEHPANRVTRKIAAVKALEEAGADILLCKGDVCNIQDMNAVKAQAQERFGGVDLILHTAGILDDAPFMGRDPEASERVLGPKVHGLNVLERLFPDGSVRAIIAFSSTSTASAPAGQVDYVAANSYIDAWAEARSNAKTRAIALAWGIWAEVGMSVSELSGEEEERLVTPVDGLALLSEKFTETSGRVTVKGRLSVRDDWVLDGHRTRDNQALLPGTGYLELIAEGLDALGETKPFELSNLYFLHPLAPGDETGCDVHLRFTPKGSGYSVEVLSKQTIDEREALILHATCTVRRGPIEAPTCLDLAGVERICTAHREEDAGGLVSAQERHLKFGDRWRTLRSTAFGEKEGVARLSLSPEFASEPSMGWKLHPALLDIATGWAMRLIPGWSSAHLWVPISYDKMRVYGDLPARVVSYIRGYDDNRADAPTAKFDIILQDETGGTVAEVKGFSLHQLDGAPNFKQAPDAHGIEYIEASRTQLETNRTLSPAEERLQAALSRGIKPHEGADAFLRVLSQPFNRMVVSSMPVPDLIAATDADTAASGQGEAGDTAAFARPELDNDFVEPSGEIEHTLVDFWRELLGVQEVGVEDSFFDLGGHSLIAVRLFAMIRKAYGVDFSISVLFEAPTIKECAALIEEEVGPQDAPEGDAGSAPGVARKSFTHIVPMSKTGSGVPFFLVAGMFGNVLNLRHLAQLIGKDRPIFGLQAKGLTGDDAPHDDLVEAAKSCIEEMRQVYDGRHWLIGGFSGGGLTAWEIARQLEAQGDSVGLTVLLDTPLPVRPSLSRLDKGLIKLHEFRRKGPGYLLDWIRARAAWKEAQQAQLDNPVLESAHQFHNTSIEAAFRASLPRYQLEARAGKTILYRPPLDLYWRVSNNSYVSREREYIIPDNGWTPFASSLDIVEVIGDHDSMVLEPNVRVLASHLEMALADAENPASPNASSSSFLRAAE